MTHPESFGKASLYGEAITLVQHNKYQWRKISRLLNRIRRQLRPHSHIHRPTQVKVAHDDVVQAFKDTKLPAPVIQAVKRGMEAEFQFVF